MNRFERKPVGRWRSLHSAIWLIGLAILFWTGRWWPGILVLVAISMILEGILARQGGAAPEEEMKEPAPPAAAPAPPVPVATPSAAPAPATFDDRFELLPSNCPRCGGPVRWQEVKWVGIKTANCAYCGSNLPLKKN